jgi:hypothetical protein
VAVIDPRGQRTRVRLNGLTQVWPAWIPSCSSCAIRPAARPSVILYTALRLRSAPGTSTRSAPGRAAARFVAEHAPDVMCWQEIKCRRLSSRCRPSRRRPAARAIAARKAARGRHRLALPLSPPALDVCRPSEEPGIVSASSPA